ncbi:ABC transporter substrate-binding protein [Stackebrandtia soli]|uniref:ABC transporter substrate-binding protein n=1 Tax=Stackebrandtia soli TaxID=1892856 RepID=UPI0039ED4F92
MSTRPLRFVGALVATMAFAVAGCTTFSPGQSAEGESWSYESGDGETITVDHLPERIIAQSDAAAALLTYGIRPVGIFGNEDPKDNRNLEPFDLEGIEVLGTEWGVVDVEAAAELNPDLIVSDYWPAEDAYGGFENSVDAKTKKLLKLAPVIGGAQGDSIVTLLEYYDGLAESLGADLKDASIAEEKAEFDAAVTAFKEAAAGNEGLTALAVSPAADLYYVAVPQYAPELLDFQKWGLDVINPESPDEEFPYWESLSWENVDKYQPDVLLIDDRTYPSNLDDAKKQPTWSTIKAAEADAVIPWPGYWVHSYPSYTAELLKLADAIAAADPTIGD